MTGQRAIPADRTRAERERDRPRGFSAVLGILVVAVCAGGLVGWQAAASTHAAMRSGYLVGRYAAVGVAALLVVIDALRESTGQGLLCLFFPPYLVFYALTHVESYWRRGLVLGVIIMAVTEFHFFPADGMLVRARDGVNTGINWVAEWIDKAGNDPDF